MILTDGNISLLLLAQRYNFAIMDTPRIRTHYISRYARVMHHLSRSTTVHSRNSRISSKPFEFRAFLFCRILNFSNQSSIKILNLSLKFLDTSIINVTPVLLTISWQSIPSKYSFQLNVNILSGKNLYQSFRTCYNFSSCSLSRKHDPPLQISHAIQIDLLRRMVGRGKV